MTPMKISTRRTAPLGDLVADAYDFAGRLTADPAEVTRLATRAVTRILGRARRLPAGWAALQPM